MIQCQRLAGCLNDPLHIAPGLPPERLKCPPGFSIRQEGVALADKIFIKDIVPVSFGTAVNKSGRSIPCYLEFFIERFCPLQVDGRTRAAGCGQNRIGAIVVLEINQYAAAGVGRKGQRRILL